MCFIIVRKQKWWIFLNWVSNLVIFFVVVLFLYHPFAIRVDASQHTKKVDHVQGCAVHFKHNEFNSDIYTLLFLRLFINLKRCNLFRKLITKCSSYFGDDVLNSFFQFMLKRVKRRMNFVGGGNKLALWNLWIFRVPSQNQKWAKCNETYERCE